MKTKAVKSLAGTERHVAALAKELYGGDVLGLVGPLGAGKTTIVQVLARMLGIGQRPRSPSYTLLQPYQLPQEIRGIRTLVHVDAYRVPGPELLDAGLADYLADPQSLVVIEWADRVASYLPTKTYWLTVQPGAKPNERVFIEP